MGWGGYGRVGGLGVVWGGLGWFGVVWGMIVVVEVHWVARKGLGQNLHGIFSAKIS